jgi:hypothetical protein
MADSGVDSAARLPSQCITVFGYTSRLRSELTKVLCSRYSDLLPNGAQFQLPSPAPPTAGNWIVLKVFDASKFPRELEISDHWLVIVPGDFTRPDWTVPPDPAPQKVPIAMRRPPQIFKIHPQFQDPNNNDWATIPFELKNFWAKTREFVFGQTAVKATSFAINDSFGSGFWVIVIWIALFLVIGLRDWTLRITARTT